MKPCDCKDSKDLEELDHSGIKFNDISLEVRPVSVFLEVGPCKVRIPQRQFKRLAEWYLEDQSIYK